MKSSPISAGVGLVRGIGISQCKDSTAFGGGGGGWVLI